MGKKTNPNAVPLSAPVKIDGQEVSEITLRKPKAGEMRGLKVSNILQMDVNELSKLLPRISAPPLDGTQVADLPADDFTALATKALTFFVAKGQMEAVVASL